MLGAPANGMQSDFAAATSNKKSTILLARARGRGEKGQLQPRATIVMIRKSTKQDRHRERRVYTKATVTHLRDRCGCCVRFGVEGGKFVRNHRLNMSALRLTAANQQIFVELEPYAEFCIWKSISNLVKYTWLRVHLPCGKNNIPTVTLERTFKMAINLKSETVCVEGHDDKKRLLKTEASADTELISFFREPSANSQVFAWLSDPTVDPTTCESLWLATCTCLT